MDSSSQQRCKRQKLDKTGRFAALERLRNLNTSKSKHKYELSNEVDNVYDTVDESEYAKRVLSRAGDDWIEDDGTGYIEDGREIFDDDEDDDENEDEQIKNKRTNDRKQKNRKRLRDINGTKSEQKGSIKSLFNNAGSKKSSLGTVKLDEDDILADILGEIQTNKSDRAEKCTEEALVKNYISNFGKIMKKNNQSQDDNNKINNDDKLIDELIKPLNQSCKFPQPSIRSEKQTSMSEINNYNDNSITNEHIANNQIETTIPTPKSTLNVEVKPELISKDLEMFTDENPETITNTIINENRKEVDNINLENLLFDWDQIANDIHQQDDPSGNDDATIDDNDTIKFWLWEAWENSTIQPGQLYLFGKVLDANKQYKTACIHLENVEHCLYLLPAKSIIDDTSDQPITRKVSFIDVYNEFNNVIAKQLHLDSFRSKKVTKKFPFHLPNVEVPESCEYLEIRCDGRRPLGKLQTSNLRSITHIFGTNKTSLETFLLDCKIKGPCWLTIRNFTIRERPLSWCKIELVCANINSISVCDDKILPPPPSLVVASINIRTAVNTRTNATEVVMIGLCINDKFHIDKPPNNSVPFQRHYCGFTRLMHYNWPNNLASELAKNPKTKTIKMESERSLLSWFLATFKNIDPDLLVTHDAIDCQLDILLQRINALNVPMWSRLGRMQFTKLLDNRNLIDWYIGRMICDIKQSAEELISLRSYDLNSLCVDILKIRENQRMDVSNDALRVLYESGDGILKLITLTLQDCFFTFKLMNELNVLPLALQISNICGNLMNVTLQAGRNKRNEYLLLHAFHEKNYIVPDRQERQTKWEQKSMVKEPKKKVKYTGGLVLEPVKGFYEKYILLMDFNSLYPSIIQEYNICFTTIKKLPNVDDDNENLPMSDKNDEQGVLPCQIRRLVESRREVKKLLNNPDLSAELRMQYHIRQMALKLTANSMYGCLGYSNSRFFAQHLAALVTRKGREILLNTKSMVQKLNYEVIYGDTDSLMINTHSDDYDYVQKIGANIKQSVNKVYRQIELDIDGVFKNLLLLKKKKYAAIKVIKSKTNQLTFVQEQKGLDMVRRDWAPVAKLTAQTVLNELFSNKSMDDRLKNIHEHLDSVRDSIWKKKVPLSLFVITKQINKNLKSYQKIQGMPHIQVAKRMNETRNRRYKPGDMVEYVICEDGTNNNPTLRSYHLDELKYDSKLTIDNLYYLTNQVHPVVMRLCEVIQETNAERIADCLGLDGSKYKQTAKIQQLEPDGEILIKSRLQKYREYDRFVFKCNECNANNLVAAAVKIHDEKMIPVLNNCSNTNCRALPYHNVNAIKNQLILSIRKYVRKFYENWKICNDTNCAHRFRMTYHYTMNNALICKECLTGMMVREYNEGNLYTQISYFQYMFDLSKYDTQKLNMPPECLVAYGILYSTVTQWLQLSQYPWVNLADIFNIGQS